MKNVITIAVALILFTGIGLGGYYLFQKISPTNFVNTTVDAITPAKKTTGVLKKVEHKLSEVGEFVFSRDKMRFDYYEERKDGLAWINTSFLWTASVPYGIDAKDLQLNYIEEENRMIVSAPFLTLYPLSITDKSSTNKSGGLWLNTDKPAKEFWEKIDTFTKKKVDEELKKDARLRKDISNTVQNAINVSIRSILEQLDINDIKLSVKVENLQLYSDEKIILN